MSKSIAEAIIRNIDDALNDLTKLRDAGEAISDEAWDNFQAIAARLKQSVEGLTDEAGREARRVAQSAATEIRRHPNETVVLAAVAAILVALLIGRRSEPDE